VILINKNLLFFFNKLWFSTQYFYVVNEKFSMPVTKFEYVKHLFPLFY